MAGSIKWFVYTTDNGTQFAIELDESNTEALNGSDGDYDNNTGVIFSVPKNLTPRYAYYQSSDGTRTIRAVALTQATYNDLLTNTRNIPDPIDTSQNLNLVRVRPEKIRIPYPQDTGLTDGDDT